MATAPEAKFSIRIDSNATDVATKDTASLQQFKTAIKQSEAAIKDYQTSLSKLKGSSEQVKGAKAELKAKIDAEKNAISEANLKILQGGSSLEKLKTQSAASAKASDENRKKTLELADAFGGVLVGAILAVETAIIAAGVKFATWVVESANAARSANLLRVAMTGSEEDARRLGNQVDALARKVPTAKNEINAMAADLSRVGLGGQTLVDTLNAATQAQAALGGDAANKVRELIERGKLMGNFSLGQFDTQGLGVQFGDVAAALATNTKTSVQDASQALIEGRVKLADGAAAMRTAMEKRFAGVNLAKMLDLDVMKEKLGETLGSLTKDVNLEPLLKAAQDFFSLFDPSTTTGSAIKDLVTMLGTGLVDAASTSLPFIKGAFKGALITVLQLADAVLEAGIWIEEALGSPKLSGDFDAFETGVLAGKVAVVALTVVLGLLAVATIAALTPMAIGLAVVLAPAIALGVAIYGIYSAFKYVSDILDSVESKLADVIKRVSEATRTFATLTGASAGSALKGGVSKIESFLPGFATGLERVPFDNFAVRLHRDEMVLPAADADAYRQTRSLPGFRSASTTADAAASGGASIVVADGAIRIEIHADGGSKRDLEDSAFLAQLTHAVRTGLTSAAIPSR